jgi:hypothetical protein
MNKPKFLSATRTYKSSRAANGTKLKNIPGVPAWSRDCHNTESRAIGF